MYILLGKVHAGVCADFGEGVPLVHAKLAHANVDVEAVVVLWVDLTFRKVIFHLLVSLFTAFDLRDELAPCLGEVTNAARDEALPPQMFLAFCAIRALARAYADEDADIAAGPFVAGSFIEHHRRRVVFAAPLIQED